MTIIERWRFRISLRRLLSSEKIMEFTVWARAVEHVLGEAFPEESRIGREVREIAHRRDDSGDSQKPAPGSDEYRMLVAAALETAKLFHSNAPDGDIEREVLNVLRSSAPYKLFTAGAIVLAVIFFGGSYWIFNGVSSFQETQSQAIEDVEGIVASIRAEAEEGLQEQIDQAKDAIRTKLGKVEDRSGALGEIENAKANAFGEINTFLGAGNKEGSILWEIDQAKDQLVKDLKRQAKLLSEELTDAQFAVIKERVKQDLEGMSSYTQWYGSPSDTALAVAAGLMLFFFITGLVIGRKTR